MKTVVLFGAGQVGAMVARLLGADYRALYGLPDLTSFREDG